MIINNPDYLVIIKQVPDPKNPSAGGTTVIAPLPDTVGYDTASEYSAPFAQGMANGEGLAARAASAMGIRLATQAMTAQLWQGSTENDISLDLEFIAEADPDKEVRQPVLALQKLAAASLDTATGLLKSPGPRLKLEDTGQLITSSASQLAKSAAQVGAAASTLLPGSVQSFLGISSSVLKTNKGMNSQTANLDANQKANGKPPVENGLGGAQYWKSVISNQISIQIGRYAYFDSVVILSVNETINNQIDARTGLPMYKKVSMRFKPMFLVTQEDLDKIFGGRQ